MPNPAKSNAPRAHAPISQPGWPDVGEAEAVVQTFLYDWIFDESRYLSYLNEVEYLSGLKRSDLGALELVSERHLQLLRDEFSPDFAKIMSEDNLNLPMSLEDSESYAAGLAEQLSEGPLSLEERDELLETEIPRDAEGRQEVYRPAPRDSSERFMLSLFMYTSFVRNSELIPDHEKRLHLANVLKSWAHVFYGSFLHIPSLVKHRSIVINGLRHVVIYPKKFSDDQVAKMIAISMPKELARLMFIFLGSEKLEAQLRQRDLADVDEPKISRFFRDCLYIDLKLRGWSKVPGQFNEHASGKKYFHEAMLSKASEVFRLGALDRRDSQNLEEYISSTFAKLYGDDRKDSERIRNKKKASLKRDQLLRVMRRGRDE
ncbi:hypothetical protein [Salipiger mucosus]|uniref:Uncharacterized protein n=1 Tax=Salipiger mucosus DSM 16094 TaxID=1123237 RepID=S9QM24_9RHOB|nr:hypothetical protein [Salipiger mucosus]EPX82516.1 hypothetical protein Salmuc_05266 [Salipiger mucosus DSM 16094]